MDFGAFPPLTFALSLQKGGGQICETTRFDFLSRDRMFELSDVVQWTPRPYDATELCQNSSFHRGPLRGLKRFANQLA
eukprot:5575705-Amphidinium_carterae.1